MAASNMTPRQRYTEAAKAIAREKGIPETLFLNLISQESSWDPKAYNNRSGATGIAQFLPSTAREMGIDPTDPYESLAGAAEYLIQNARTIQGRVPSVDGDEEDWLPAFIAYGAGAGNVLNAIKAQRSSPNPAQGHWMDKLPEKDGVREQAYQHKEAIFSNISAEKPGSLGRTARSVYEPGAGGNQTKPRYTGTGAVDPQDFYSDPLGDGNWVFDAKGYYEAKRSEMESRLIQRDLDMGPTNQYVDDVIKQLTLEIQSGELEVSKASQVLSTRLSSYKTAQDAYQSEAFGYGAPAGAGYWVGQEPDSYASRVLGLHPRTTQGAVYNDPMAEALSVYQEAQNQMGAIGGKVQIPNIPGLRGGTPGAPPPPPPPAPEDGFNRSAESLGGSSNIDPGINRIPEGLRGNEAIDPGIVRGGDAFSMALAELRRQGLLQGYA